MMHISIVCTEVIAASVVEEVNDPDLAIQSALLHDVIEDTEVDYEKIEDVF